MSAPLLSHKDGAGVEEGSSRAVIVAGIIAVGVIAGVTGFNLPYGAAAAAGTLIIAMLVFAPKIAFYGLLYMITGWPYYVGIPVGRDLPAPFVLPVIWLMSVFVLLRQGLGLDPALPPDPRSKWLDAALAALAMVLIVSILLGGNVEFGFRSYLRVALMPGLIYLCCRHFIRDPQTARLSMDVLLAGSAVAGIYAAYEWSLGRNPLLEHFAPPVGDLADHGYWTGQEAAFGSTLYRSHGFGMNPIFFGTTPAILLCHAATRLATSRNWRNTLFVLALAAPAALGLICTFSRSPIISCVVGLAIVAIAYPALRKYLLGAGLVIGAYTLFEIFGSHSLLSERLNDSDNVTLRMKLWQTAWSMFTDFPIFGVGLGNYPDHQLSVIREHKIGPFFEMGDGHLEVVKTAEHGVLQYLAETGLLGAAVAAALLVAVLSFLVPALFARRHYPERPQQVAAGAGFFVFLAAGFSVTIYNSWEAGSLVPVSLAVLAASRAHGVQRSAPLESNAVTSPARAASSGSDESARR
jgi:O-Antigen ligase